MAKMTGAAISASTPQPSSPSQESVQRQAVRQDLGFCNRSNRRGQKAGAETDHHERQYWMACDDAEQCRHQSILVLPSLVSQS